MKRVDIVIPAFNEAACLPHLVPALQAAVAGQPYRFRFLVVDDGSTDDTAKVANELRASEPRLGLIRLARNFGHQAAITAGLDLADADAVLTMDADLQHPPAAIPDLLAAWEDGAEIVSAVRAGGVKPGFLKRTTSRAFYFFLNLLSRVKLTADSPDFRLLDAKVVDAVRSVREQSRFLRGIYDWVGFRRAEVPYEQQARAAGRTKYGLFRMLAFALTAVLSFSRTPLRMATWMGLLVSGLSFAYGIYAMIMFFVFRQTVPGWTSLAVLLSFLSGIQLLFLGVIGEYLGQVLDETKRRPLYLTCEVLLPDGANGEAEPTESSRP